MRLRASGPRILLFGQVAYDVVAARFNKDARIRHRPCQANLAIAGELIETSERVVEGHTGNERGVAISLTGAFGGC